MGGTITKQRLSRGFLDNFKFDIYGRNDYRANSVAATLGHIPAPVYGKDAYQAWPQSSLPQNSEAAICRKNNYQASSLAASLKPPSSVYGRNDSQASFHRSFFRPFQVICMAGTITKQGLDRNFLENSRNIINSTYVQETNITLFTAVYGKSDHASRRIQKRLLMEAICLSDRDLSSNPKSSKTL
jgi:hypothetical protein